VNKSKIEYDLENYSELTKWQISHDLSGGDKLTDSMKLPLYRIFQEAMVNIVKHAKATAIKVSLYEQDGRIFLNVEDNGIGVSEADLQKEHSFGILGMSERARKLEGNFEISGKPGEGSRIAVSVPIAAGSRQTA